MLKFEHWGLSACMIHITLGVAVAQLCQQNAFDVTQTLQYTISSMISFDLGQSKIKICSPMGCKDLQYR